MAAKWPITVFVISDDTMQLLAPKTHYHAKLSNSEILTVAVVAAKYFNNNRKLTLRLLYQPNWAI